MKTVAKKFKFRSEKKKEKWHLFRMQEGKNTPLTGPYLELYGNREVVLDGCLGVYEYGDTFIKLRLKSGAVTVCGDGLEMIFFEEERIDIKGIITSVEFGV